MAGTCLISSEEKDEKYILCARCAGTVCNDHNLGIKNFSHKYPLTHLLCWR